MLLNMLNDLTEATKALDGKKWGDPWFPHWALLLPTPSVLAHVFLWRVLLFVYCMGLHQHTRCHFACTEMILSYHLLLNRSFSPINWYLSRHCSVVCVVFWFVCFCFCVFVSFLCLVLCLVLVFCFSLFCFVFWMNVTVHRTMYRSSTSLLLRPLQQRPLRDLIDSLIPIATCSETCWTTWRKP